MLNWIFTRSTFKGIKYKVRSNLMKSMRSRQRKLMLQAKTAMDQRVSNQEKSQLLRNPAAASITTRDNNNKKAHQVAAIITTALKRTNALMIDEVHRSSQTLALLSESSSVLSKTNSQYHNDMSASLQDTNKALTKLFSRDFTDRLLLGLSVAVFVSVCLYILKARLWD